jgi:hypothetical protein
MGKSMTSPLDVQNVPDVWGLLERAASYADSVYSNGADEKSTRAYSLYDAIQTALAQHERFVLVPKEPTIEQLAAVRDVTSLREMYRSFLIAAPKPEGKRDWLRGTPSADFPEGEP